MIITGGMYGRMAATQNWQLLTTLILAAAILTGNGEDPCKLTSTVVMILHNIFIMCDVVTQPDSH